MDLAGRVKIHLRNHYARVRDASVCSWVQIDGSRPGCQRFQRCLLAAAEVSFPRARMRA